jgi:Tfp pilus assembly protein PilF
LLALTSAIFWPVLGFDFVIWDDDLHIYDNPRFVSLSWANILAFWYGPYAHLYIPLTYTVWGALVWISRTVLPGPLTAELFHRLNLLLHLANTLIVYRVGCLWLSSVGPPQHRTTAAALGALIFALHPLQVEAVAWVSGLKDVFSGFLALIAVWQYLEFAHARGRKRPWSHYGLATVAFGCALLAKPAVVVTPMVAGVLAARHGGRKVWYPLGGWLLLALAWSVWTKMQQPDAALAFIPTWWQRLLVASDALVFYGWKILWPLQLGPDYGRTPQLVTEGMAALPAALLVTGCLVVWWHRRRHRGIGIAAAVFTLGVLPVLGLVPFLFQAYSTVADRYTYFAMLGIALGAGWFGQAWGQRWRGLLVGAMLIIGLLGWRSSQQIQVWRHTVTLFTHALQVNPCSAVAHNNLGLALAQQGNVPQAIAHYTQALQLKATMPEAHYNLADALAAQGELHTAIVHYTKALDLKPSWAEVHNNLGTALAKQGEVDAAIAHYIEALRLRPDWALPYNNLGDAMVKQGRITEAMATFTKAAQLTPLLPEAPYNLAGILWQQGHRSDAIMAYREALRRRPQWPQVANNLAWLLITQATPTAHDIAEAVVLAEQACEGTEFRNPIALRTLAAAYRAAGRSQAATSVAQQALSHINTVNDPGLAALMREQLHEYQTDRESDEFP